ncbi:MAG: hypothetical protein U1A72_17040 [Sulfuritalea sp.]|nr:hypothetical protein [Sulfuritalea sp.]
MTDHRLDLAIMFAERLVDLQDMPAMKACRVAAATHDLDAEALVTEWCRRLLAARLERRAAHPAQAAQRQED